MVPDNYFYPGKELELFKEAINWKNYLKSHLTKYITGNVLEVGAGIGESTRILYNSKVEHWTCLEPDNNFVRTISNKIVNSSLPSTCSVIRGTVNDLPLNNGSFDTVLYIDVLEHILKEEEEVKYAKELIKVNGYLVILAPAFNTLYTEFDNAVGHYRRYTKKTLAKIIPVEMKKESLYYIESMGVVVSFANKIFMKQRIPTAKQVYIWDKYIVTISKILDRIIFYQWGKSLIGIWKKIN